MTCLTEHLQQLVDQQTISFRSAKQVLDVLWRHGRTPETIIAEHQLTAMRDTEQFRDFTLEAIRNNPKQVKKYLNGNNYLTGSFIE